MAQSLELNIKTTSDVPQAMDKAKEAISSLEKRAASTKVGTASNAVEQTTGKATSGVASQFDKIGKAFGNTISSVFLSFVGPLAIIQGIISLVSDYIAEAKQLADDGINRIAEGRTDLASDEESKMAKFFKAKDAREKEEREVEAGKRAMTLRFLTETPEGIEYLRQKGAEGYSGVSAGDKETQQAALKAFLASDEGKKYSALFDAENKAKESTVKAPEGFSNVVGVGANPVLQAMDEALTESKKQTGLLEQMVSKQGNYDDFTKTDMYTQKAAVSIANL